MVSMKLVKWVGAGILASVILAFGANIIARFVGANPLIIGLVLIVVAGLILYLTKAKGWMALPAAGAAVAGGITIASSFVGGMTARAGNMGAATV